MRTLAHRDIAFEFASWISPEFKLYFTVQLHQQTQDFATKAAHIHTKNLELRKEN